MSFLFGDWHLLVFFFLLQKPGMKKKEEGIEKGGMNNTVHSVNVQHVKVSL